MKKEVTMEDILRAITELSDELKETKIELKDDIKEINQKIDATKTELKQDIANLDHKMDLIDQKFMLTDNDLRTAQAEIKVLQRGVN